MCMAAFNVVAVKFVKLSDKRPIHGYKRVTFKASSAAYG